MSASVFITTEVKLNSACVLSINGHVVLVDCSKLHWILGISYGLFFRSQVTKVFAIITWHPPTRISFHYFVVVVEHVGQVGGNWYFFLIFYSTVVNRYQFTNGRVNSYVQTERKSTARKKYVTQNKQQQQTVEVLPAFRGNMAFNFINRCHSKLSLTLLVYIRDISHFK